MAFENRNLKMFIARQEAGMTQQELAEKIGTSANYISKIERQHEKGSLEIKTRIARALGKGTEELFGKFE